MHDLQQSANRTMEKTSAYHDDVNYGDTLDTELERASLHHAKSTYRRRNLIVVLACAGIVAAIVGIALAVSGNDNEAESANSAAGSTPAGAGDPTLSTLGGSAPTPVVPNSPEAEQAQRAILSVARFGGSEFDDASSYQSRAMAWVLSQSLPSSGSLLGLDDQAVQLYAMGCIYYNTFSTRSAWTDFHFGPDVAIPGWFSARGWLEDPSDVCTWYGIECNDQGRVSTIDLATNGLTGYFPPETALLHDSLTKIDLYNNIVHNHGDLGNSFLGELTNLEYLYYGTTSFEYDGIPTEIGRLTNLIEYDCSYTLYFGELQGASFENLSNLNYLVMDGNAYNSSFPAELIALPNLQFVYAGFSFLEGGLEFVKDMPKIVELWLDDNPGLSASIPSSMGLSTTLASFSASNCELFGTLPTELGLITEMIQIWAFKNKLSGTLRESALSWVTYTSGTNSVVPHCCMFSSFHLLLYFSGTIPTELGNLVKMKVLDLQLNLLTGTMPAEICARRDPFGRLDELEADCAPTITCDCCTCCGDQCKS
jgi:hypothetical protein